MIDVGRKEIAKRGLVAILERHDEHLVGAPGALSEFGGREFRLNRPHRGEGLGHRIVGIVVSHNLDGALTLFGAALDDRGRRFLVPGLGPEHVFQAHHQKDSDHSKDQKREHAVFHATSSDSGDRLCVGPACLYLERRSVSVHVRRRKREKGVLHVASSDPDRDADH